MFFAALSGTNCFLNVDNLRRNFDLKFSSRMKKMLILPLLLVIFHGYGQYYYNDILSNDQGNRQYQLLKTAKIHKVKVTSFEADGKPSEGFFLEEEFTADWTKMTTSSNISTGASSVLTSYYLTNRLRRTDETKRGVETKTEYSYDEKGRVSTITSTSMDTSLKSQSVETHIWQYKVNGLPDQMLKLKNKLDSTRITFVYDDLGNPAEEHWKKNNRELETYYYYYNDKHLLTDIVRFNKRVSKLLPDFLFEYDATGRLTQMTQVPANSSNYTTWKYVYTDSGLKKEEVCYDKQKNVIGKIEYAYE